MSFKCNVCGSEIFDVMHRIVNPYLSNVSYRLMPKYQQIPWYQINGYHEFSALCFHCGEEWGPCNDLEELTKTMNEAGVLK